MGHDIPLLIDVGCGVSMLVYSLGGVTIIAFELLPIDEAIVSGAVTDIVSG